MPVGRHSGHHTPVLCFRVEAFDRVEGFQPISSTHYEQSVVDDRHTELQTPPGHVGDERPAISAPVITLDADRACNSKLSFL